MRLDSLRDTEASLRDLTNMPWKLIYVMRLDSLRDTKVSLRDLTTMPWKLTYVRLDSSGVIAVISDGPSTFFGRDALLITETNVSHFCSENWLQNNVFPSNPRRTVLLVCLISPQFVRLALHASSGKGVWVV